MGMAPNPGESYSLESRLLCARCGCNPKVLNPEKIGNSSGMLSITVECHGQQETKMLEKRELVFIQKFFEGSDDD